MFSSSSFISFVPRRSSVRVLVLLGLALAHAALAQRLLSDKDVDRIAAQWDEGEEEDPDDPAVQFMKRQAPSMENMDPQQMMAAEQRKTKMLFATIKDEFAPSKAEAEKLSV